MAAPPAQPEALPKVGASAPGVVVIPQRAPTPEPSNRAARFGAKDANIDAALQQVAADLESVRDLAAEAVQPGVAAHEPPNEPGADNAAPAPPIQSIEDLDRALAEIAEQSAPAAPDIDAHDHAQAARRKAAAPVINAAAPDSKAAPDPAAEPDADPPAPEDEEALPTGDFDAPTSHDMAPAPSAAQPEEPVAAAPHADAPDAEAPTAPVRPAPGPAPAPSIKGPIPVPTPVAAPPAATAATATAPAPAPKPGAAPARRASLRNILLFPVRLANEPFSNLEGRTTALETLSLISVITIFNAVCLWVFLFLR